MKVPLVFLLPPAPVASSSQLWSVSLTSSRPTFRHWLGSLLLLGAPPPQPCSAPSAPPSIDSMTDMISAHIPSLACTANALVNPADATSKPASCPTPVPAANTGAASIVSSLANMAASSGIMSFVPSAPPPSDGKRNSPATPRIALPEDHHTGMSINQSINQLIGRLVTMVIDLPDTVSMGGEQNLNCENSGL